MLMPSIFGESFLNDFIEPFETSNNSSTFMNTDVEAVSYTHLTLPTN